MKEAEFISGRSGTAGGVLPEGFRIYAIGDIHGRADLLYDLLLAITVDIDARPIRSPMIVFLGDYIDRGPQSAGVIDQLLMVRRIIPTVCLAGNHEIYALRFMRDPSSGPSWFELGGRETLSSYGIAVPWRLTSRVVEELSRSFAAAVPDEHRHFLATLGSTVSFGDYLFVHAGVDPAISVAEQSHTTLTTIREPFLNSVQNFGRTVVHGHSPVSEPDIRGNRINIDTGAYITGKLTCLVLENATRRLL